MESASLVAPEGVYTVVDEQRPPPPNANLPSTQQVYPTRLSTITINFPPPKSSGPGFSALLGGTIKPKDSDKQGKKTSGNNKDKDPNGYDESLSSSDQGDEISDPTEADTTTSPQQPTSLFSPGPDAQGKKKNTSRRPKHNIRTTSSSFVTRLQSMESLNRHLSSKTGEVTFMFYNAAKSFFWTEVGLKLKDPLARITFSAHPTCHSVNQTTANHTAIDVVIGFNTGDLIWFDPLSSRYVRLNKGGCITSSPCTEIHWVPSSRSLFTVAHADGSIIVYDREREDSLFVPRDPGLDPHLAPSSPLLSPNGILADPYSALNPNAASLSPNGNSAVPAPAPLSSSPSSVPVDPLLFSPSDQQQQPQFEWNALEDIIVTPGPSGIAALAGGGKDKDKVPRNPISHWRVSRKPLTAFAFAPNCRHVAVVSEDGYLRVIDALSERLEDSYAAYFGSFTCVSWSPDGRFILAGGQDDLLTIFAPFEQRIVARCQGHSSFVSGLAFDSLRCNGRTYRFASVGEDNKVIFWDFSSGALHRPKAHGHTARLSLSSTISLALRRREASSDLVSIHQPTSPPPGTTGPSGSGRVHSAPSRNDVAVLQPVVAKVVEGDLLSSVLCIPSGVFTISRAGSMKYWVRPLPMRSNNGPRRGVSLTRPMGNEPQTGIAA